MISSAFSNFPYDPTAFPEPAVGSLSRVGEKIYVKEADGWKFLCDTDTMDHYLKESKYFEQLKASCS